MPRDGAPRDRHGAWTQAAWDAAEERDATRRETRPPQPSRSTHPHRCTACGHWALPCDWCPMCGLAFVPAPLVGPAPVTGR